MQITPIRLFSVNYNNSTKQYPNFAPLKNDVVSFGQEPDNDDDIIDLSDFLVSSDSVEPSTPEDASLVANDEDEVIELPDLSEESKKTTEETEDAPSKLLQDLCQRGPFSYDKNCSEMPETD